MRISRAGTAAYEKRRSFLVDQRRWRYSVPVPDVAAHIAALRSAGMTLAQMALLTGVHPKHLSVIGRGQGRYVTAATAGKILSVRPGSARPPSGRVDATGTRRRLQALAVAGWSAAQLAARTGLTEDTLARVRRGLYPTVAIATARAVDQAFRELWNTRPPQRTAYERRSAAKAAEDARRSGWAPACAWDDIDDPAARPRGVRAELRNEARPMPETGARPPGRGPDAARLLPAGG